jgi:hypothetical protein
VDTAAKVLPPYFYLLFDWAFSPSEVVPPLRLRAPDTRAAYLNIGDNLEMPNAENDDAIKLAWSERSLIRALATTPTLSDLVSKQIGDGPALYQAFRFIPSAYGNAATSFRSVFERFVRNDEMQGALVLTELGAANAAMNAMMAGQSAEFDSANSVGMSTSEARRAILAIYVAQALADADNGNLHRAHVILSDSLRIMSMGQGSSKATGGSITALFGTVVNQSNLDAFTAALSRYVEEQADALVVSGENASVLNAAGLRNGAEFIRAALLAKYELLVMPLIAKAQSRAGNAGYRPPESLTRFQKQIRRHVDTLRGNDDSEAKYLRRAVTSADAGYSAVLQRFRDMWSGNSEASLEKTLAELRTLGRPVQNWYEEKRISAANCPLQFISAGLDSEELSIGLPLDYDEAEQKFKETNVLEFVTAQELIGEDIKTWCSDGSSSSPFVRTGHGHFVLGWYWLEAGQPALARQAWIDGARTLLESPEVADDRGGKISVTGLLNEVNAYRLLVAASFITIAPPGVIVDRTNTYETEIRAIASEWVSTWTFNGHPKKEAQRVIESMFSADDESFLASESRHHTERYPFFEYRFRFGSIPDVLVDEAVTAKVFNSDGVFFVDETASPQETHYQRISKLFRGFVLPSEFSEGAKRRWKQD